MRADKAWLAGKVGHLAKGHNTVSAHARTSHRALPTGLRGLRCTSWQGYVGKHAYEVIDCYSALPYLPCEVRLATNSVGKR